MSHDAVIVGGGVIGLAIAYELGRRGRQVTVLERRTCGSGATQAAGGMLAAASEAETEPQPLVDFCRDSLGRYDEFIAAVERASSVDCGYRKEGTLWVATRRDSMEEIHHLQATLAKKGISAAFLTAQQVREREPRLTDRILGGLDLASDGQVDPRKLTRALAAAIRATGGTILESARVEAIESRTVRGTHDGRPLAIEARDVVLAAGVWSNALGPMKLRPVKGQIVRLHGTPLLRHVIRTNDVYLIPRHDGELLLGATAEEMGYDETPTAGAAMDLLRRAWEVLPAIYELTFREISVGLRPAFDHPLPVIGRGETEDLWLALGHHRNGVLLAPATAAYLASWIMEGKEPEALKPFAADAQAGVPTWTA